MTDAATLGIAAAVALGVWLLVLGVLAVATRAREPRAAAATMELGGDESPGVVNLLTNGWAVGKAAVPATLIDLAAREVVGFERVGPERYAVRVPDRRPPELTSYEAQVYDHVRGLASGGIVPCEALTTGPENESKRWWRQFRTAVSADARERGLSRPRWTRAQLLVLGVVAAAPAGLAAGAFAALPSTSSSKSNDDPVLGIIGIAVFLWVALMALPRQLRAERETPAGLAAAGRWLGLRTQLSGDTNFAQQPPAAVAIWDRLLGYGAAMGVAPGAVRVLPMGAESETHAWTAYGGRWRVVHIRYPQRFPPGWGRSPAAAVAVGLLWVVPVTFVSYVFVARVPALPALVGLAIAAVLFIGFAYGAGTSWSGVADIGRRRTLEGEVLRRKDVVTHNDSGSSTTAVYLAVYDGNGGELRALRCAPQVASGVQAGDVVRVTVSPHLGHVSTLERLGPMVSIQTGS